MSLRDALGRPLRSLRLSVTDRCNIRCAYCMPEVEYAWLPRHDLLTFEEMTRLIQVFTRVGVDRVRITGGEPLLRRDLPRLVDQIAALPAIGDLALTTNGVLLARHAAALHAAGLHRVTVSLDTLRRDRFERLTRFDRLHAVLDGIAEAARRFGGLKLDTVVMRDVNDDELEDIIEFGRQYRAEVRFIEYMDVGGATRWDPGHVVSRVEMLEALGRRYGRPARVIEDSSAPADRYRLPDGTVFGVISSTTAPFCGRCDRARLTADGHWLLCLYAESGLDLRAPLRSGAPDDVLESLVRVRWGLRRDRGAEERLVLVDRRAQVPHEGNVHHEMHTRGG